MEKNRTTFILGKAEVVNFGAGQDAVEMGQFSGIFDGEPFKAYCQKKVIMPIIGKPAGSVIEIGYSLKVDGNSKKLKISIESLTAK